MKLIAVMLGLLLLVGFAALAEESRDEDVAQRAKHRLYPGGPDESDLKVQNPLPTPTRKVSPTLEDDKSEPAADD